MCGDDRGITCEPWECSTGANAPRATSSVGCFGGEARALRSKRVFRGSWARLLLGQPTGNPTTSERLVALRPAFAGSLPLQSIRHADSSRAARVYVGVHPHQGATATPPCPPARREQHPFTSRHPIAFRAVHASPRGDRPTKQIGRPTSRPGSSAASRSTPEAHRFAHPPHDGIALSRLSTPLLGSAYHDSLHATNTPQPWAQLASAHQADLSFEESSPAHRLAPRPSMGASREAPRRSPWRLARLRVSGDAAAGARASAARILVGHDRQFRLRAMLAIQSEEGHA
jgi:hypothetical protein